MRRERPDATFREKDEDMKMYNAYDRDIAKVKFFFSKSTVPHFRKRARLSNLDYVAQIGGIFGFCVGCSLISGFEFFYWVVLKFIGSKVNGDPKAKKGRRRPRNSSVNWTRS